MVLAKLGVIATLVLIGQMGNRSTFGQERSGTPRTEREYQYRDLRGMVAAERERLAEQLADTIVSREVAARTAEAEFHRAEQRREAAEYALKGYLEGVHDQELETRRGDVALAKADRDHATDVLARLQAEEARGQRVGRDALQRATLQEQKSKFALEQAQLELELLERYELDRNRKLLQARIGEARQAEQLARTEWNQRLEELKYRKQLADNARTRSPEDLLLNLLDKVERGEAEIARLTREASAATEQVVKDPRSAEARARSEATRRSLQVAVEATRTALRDAVALADETADLRQRYANAERQLIAERKALLEIPDPMDQRLRLDR